MSQQQQESCPDVCPDVPKCPPSQPPPKLTVIFILEQTQYAELQYLQPYLKGGIGKILRKGVNYTNATLAHICCDSTPSHSGWSTGAPPNNHGLVDNSWEVNGVRVYPTYDYSPLSAQALTYVPNTSYGNAPGQVYPLSHYASLGIGQANRNIQCDTLADQLVFQSTAKSTKQFYCVTNDQVGNGPCVIPAGQLGKPFWFDEIAGGYSSSQAFFPSAYLQITGANGSGYGALASLTVVNGTVTSVLVQNGGINYQNP